MIIRGELINYKLEKLENFFRELGNYEFFDKKIGDVCIKIYKKKQDIMVFLPMNNIDYQLSKEIVNYYIKKWNIYKKINYISKTSYGNAIRVYFIYNISELQYVKKIFKYGYSIDKFNDGEYIYSIPIVLFKDKLIYQKFYTNDYRYDHYFKYCTDNVIKKILNNNAKFIKKEEIVNEVINDVQILSKYNCNQNNEKNLLIIGLIMFFPIITAYLFLFIKSNNKELIFSSINK